MTENEKYTVLAKLALGTSARDIAEEANVPYTSVLKLKREYEEAKTLGELDKLYNMDRLALASLAEGAPTELADASREVVSSVTGLEMLSEELQKTARLINTRVSSLVMGADSVAELAVASEILCSLQTAFLNKSVTQINIQNNHEPKYNQFLSDKVND